MAKRAEDIIGFKPLAKKPELDFDPEVMTLTQILSNNTLPKVIRCDETNVPPKEDTNYIDLAQPLLIYCKNSVRKVCAQNLAYDKQRQMFQSVGSDLLIPDTYLGWFAVMGSPEDYTTDQPVPHYRTLAQLATSQCTEFLVGGNNPIEGIMMDKSKGKNIRCNILPGDVLKKAGNYVAQFSNDDKKKHKKKKKKKGKEESQQQEVYIKCYDRQDREIFIPACQIGIFFVVAQNSKLKSQVMQMPSILERYKFPLIVTLIYGTPPKIPCAFTGTLLLTDSGMSHTVVASTLFNIKNINFEIPLSSNLKFHVAVENPGLRGCSDYIKALKSCESNAQSYMRNIKVIIGDPKLENDNVKSGPKDYTQASEQTELRLSQKGQKSPTTPSNDKIANPISRGSRRSTFKDLSTRLTINTDTDSLGETSSGTSGLLRSEEYLTSSPKLQRDNAYDPPGPSHTIPILSGSISLAQLSTPTAHEYDSATLKPTSSSSKGDYIEIWRKKADNPPMHTFVDDLGYLISPRYKEDIQRVGKQGGDLPSPHPHVPKRSLSNPTTPSSVPIARQKLRDLKSNSVEDRSGGMPASDLHSTNNYINFIPQYFDRIEDLSGVERFSQISMGEDDDVPPPIPLRRQPSDSEFLTSTFNSSAPPRPPAVVATPISTDQYDPYQRPNTLSLRNIKLDSPETFKVRQGTNRDANSGIADSGIYVEEDPLKDENDNVTGARRNPNDYISMCDAFPLLIKPIQATKGLNSPPRPSSDSTTYSTNTNSSRKSPPAITSRSVNLAEAVDIISKKHLLIKDIRNSGMFLSKQLELTIMNLTPANFSQILHEKQDVDATLKKIFPQVNQPELSIIAQCVQKMNSEAN